MNPVKIYEEVVLLSEQVLVGKLTIQQAHIRLEVLAEQAKEQNIDLNVIRIMGAIEEELLASQTNYYDAQVLEFEYGVR